ncbi:unnamed protein product [Lupinus luteus]|uniref:EF-hand domain-containing protein n=1 Tax=Lupinus luteus TaxID=3873 RepID=A0AAV1YAV7_LUPLU
MCPSGRSLRPTATAYSATSNFRPAFDILDADRDGKISRDDLRAFYTGIYGSDSGGDDAIGAMMALADTNNNGFVEYEEFEHVVTGERRTLGFGAMEDVFRLMDKDGDGMLSHQDLKSYMAVAGFSATDEEINAMIKFGGGGENGGVSFDGLLRILALNDFVSN